MSELTVSEHFVRAALGGAANRGVDTLALLRAAGISPALLQGPGARVTGSQYTQLMQLLWATLQDEFMGFTEHPSKPGTFATFCLLVIHCTTLEGVYRRGKMFYDLFEKPVSMSLRREGDDAWLEVCSAAPFDDPHHFLQESLLVIWHRFSCWLIGETIALSEATFDYPRPDHGDEYRHLFYAPHHFNAPRTGLRFPAHYLSKPVVRDEVELKRFLSTSPADLLARPDDRTSFTARIRAIIGREFQQDGPDFEAIAAQLNVSPQTLRRRLKEENTSYQEIKDTLRRDLAIYHLSRGDLSINDIAHRCGFTEPSTFHRAFKKWTGLTPGAFREGER